MKNLLIAASAQIRLHQHSQMSAPRAFKETVLADLKRAQRLILRIGDEIDPQFRIGTPEGDLWVAMTLSDDPRRA